MQTKYKNLTFFIAMYVRSPRLRTMTALKESDQTNKHTNTQNRTNGKIVK